MCLKSASNKIDAVKNFNQTGNQMKYAGILGCFIVINQGIYAHECATNICGKFPTVDNVIRLPGNTAIIFLKICFFIMSPFLKTKKIQFYYSTN